MNSQQMVASKPTMKNFNWKHAGLLVLGLATTAGVASAQDVRVRVNGQPFRAEVAPVTENGRVLVPMRAIFERLGARVDYNRYDRSIVARRSGTVVSMTLGRQRAFVGNDAVRLDVPARSFDGRTMVPLRFVSEALGANVDYDSYRMLVSIEDGVGGNRPDGGWRNREGDGNRLGRNWRDRDGDGFRNDRDGFPNDDGRN